MKELKMFALSILILIGLSGVASAEIESFAPGDFVGFSFWLVSMGCLAATVFFFLERGSVAPAWRVSITVAGLITGITFVQYIFLRNIWIMTGDTPTVYRYVDWFITMPLLILEFYFVLSTVKKVPGAIFWKLLLGSVIMLIGGYFGETGYIPPMLGFVIWMAGWIYILYEVFSGDAGKMAAKNGNKALVTAFGAMRMIVTIGWVIYPLGYIFAGIEANSLNIIYNAADLLNKIVFGLIIWVAAVQNTSSRAK